MTGDFGHDILNEVPERVFRLAEKALTSANTQATYFGPGIEHWPAMAVLSACHAMELFLKASISVRHPLLIFKNVFDFKAESDASLSLDELIKSGRSHDFEKLPTIYWAVSGKQINSKEVFDRARQLRNALQHFLEPDEPDTRRLTLSLLYEVIDPLIFEEFGICAINYIEMIDDGSDYLVKQLIDMEMRFTMPTDFQIGEVNWCEHLSNVSEEYSTWFRQALEDRTGKNLDQHMETATWFH